MMAGDRQLVRNAVAAYFGGTLQTSDAGTYYQGGPLSSSGLGTAFPYLIKGGAPDSYYTLGEADGTGWGAVMTVRLAVVIRRDSYGGATSGWRARRYRVTCSLDVISYAEHLEEAEAPLDDLLNAMDSLVYADRTLGTTSAAYAAQGGRLIIQAGEEPFGIVHGEPEWSVEADRGRGRGGIDYTFEALTMVAALGGLHGEVQVRGPRPARGRRAGAGAPRRRAGVRCRAVVRAVGSARRASGGAPRRAPVRRGACTRTRWRRRRAAQRTAVAYRAASEGVLT